MKAQATKHTNQMKKSVIRGAGILAACALISKIVGALYRIPLTNILGAEGIGLYQMIFPLYAVFLTLSGGGLSVAVAKVVAGKSDGQARSVVKACLPVLSIAGVAASVLLFSLGGVLARWQGNPSAAWGYAGIAPAVFFVAVTACLRGYFQGRQNVLPTAVGQLTEQLVKLAAGLLLSALLLRKGVAYGVLGGALGVTLSEAVATGLILWQYARADKRPKTIANKTHVQTIQDVNPRGKPRIRSRQSQIPPQATEGIPFDDVTNAPLQASKFVPCLNELIPFEAAADAALPLPPNKQTPRRSAVWVDVGKIALPVTLSALVMPLVQLTDSLLVINLLVRSGMNADKATALYGIVTGPVNSLINMPTVVTLALSSTMLPVISALHAQRKSVRGQLKKPLLLATATGLAFVLALCLLGKIAVRFLYASGLTDEQLQAATALTRVSAIAVLYVSLLQIATAALQGCDKPKLPAVHLSVGAVLKLALTLLLLPRMGITGVVVASVACYAMVCLLDVWAMCRFCR